MIHDNTEMRERKKERKKERHLRQMKNEKMSCLRWDVHVINYSCLFYP